MKPQTDAACQEAVARGDVYRFLSAVYLGPPTPGLVQNLHNAELFEELAPVLTERAAAELKHFTECLDPDQSIALLEQEYMALFAVPAGRYVTPFEDVYRGVRQDGKRERGPLLGERAVAVKILYREAGAQIDQACKELPTHVGVELSFMAFLCEREAAAIGHEAEREQDTTVQSYVYRQYQHKFLEEHLNSWFPQLNQAIQEKTESSFYRCLAQLTEDFLASDIDALRSQSRWTAAARDQVTSIASRTVETI